MILLSTKNWGVVQRQKTGIKKLLDSFDPEEKCLRVNFNQTKIHMVENAQVYLTEDKGVAKKILVNGDENTKPQKG